MATLHHHYDRVVIVVTGLGVQLPHLFVGNDARELVETVSGIVKGRRVGWVRAHPRGELVHWDIDAEAYNVPDEVGRVDLGETLTTAQSSINPLSPTLRAMGGDRKT